MEKYFFLPRELDQLENGRRLSVDIRLLPLTVCCLCGEGRKHEASRDGDSGTGDGILIPEINDKSLLSDSSPSKVLPDVHPVNLDLDVVHEGRNHRLPELSL